MIKDRFSLPKLGTEESLAGLVAKVKKILRDEAFRTAVQEQQINLKRMRDKGANIKYNVYDNLQPSQSHIDEVYQRFVAYYFLSDQDRQTRDTKVREKGNNFYNTPKSPDFY